MILNDIVEYNVRYIDTQRVTIVQSQMQGIRARHRQGLG